MPLHLKYAAFIDRAYDPSLWEVKARGQRGQDLSELLSEIRFQNTRYIILQPETILFPGDVAVCNHVCFLYLSNSHNQPLEGETVALTNVSAQRPSGFLTHHFQ